MMGEKNPVLQTTYAQDWLETSFGSVCLCPIFMCTDPLIDPCNSLAYTPIIQV